MWKIRTVESPRKTDLNELFLAEIDAKFSFTQPLKNTANERDKCHRYEIMVFFFDRKMSQTFEKITVNNICKVLLENHAGKKIQLYTVS